VLALRSDLLDLAGPLLGGLGLTVAGYALIASRPHRWRWGCGLIVIGLFVQVFG
jgi:hypothetical protein